MRRTPTAIRPHTVSAQQSMLTTHSSKNMKKGTMAVHYCESVYSVHTIFIDDIIKYMKIINDDILLCCVQCPLCTVRGKETQVEAINVSEREGENKGRGWSLE